MEFQATFSRRVTQACRTARDELLAARGDHGHWEGELSSSALATATAISALSQYRDHSLWPVIRRPRMQQMIDQGVQWLLGKQNADGGWGDTDFSHSNIATTLLAVSAMTLSGAGETPDLAAATSRANRYVEEQGRLFALRKRYGKDKTFAVPILANCAIAGLVPWKEVAALPFEAALLPQKFYRFVRLPVVSYAIPALVAIGQLKFIKDPPWNPLVRLTRRASLRRGMAVLEKMQPGSGGFLEAIPLTCFVAMSLAHTGRADHEVTRRCLQFVDDSFRDLGSEGTWPIDTNLATWNTTLAINALPDQAAAPDRAEPAHLTPQLLDWLLDCQNKTIHPFTGAEPGGWGWSDLDGAVPDADDTPGALLALRRWLDQPDTPADKKQEIQAAAESATGWLLDLQNRDGGWPTFCRGWGRMPFDRSGSDITAHVLRALLAWQAETDGPEIQAAIASGFAYLKKNSLPEGGWYPLWFGNQDQPGEENPIYGTVKVLLAYRDAGMLERPEATQALDWLLRQQNEDFGWGGGPSNQPGYFTGTAKSNSFSSVQETSLVLELLASLVLSAAIPETGDIQQACERGCIWLVEAVEHGKLTEKWPIGFYFAKLWYYERLYPLVFGTAALVSLNRLFGSESQVDSGETPAKITVS